MPIRIVSKRDGFRRCGMPHSSKPTTYPDGHFTDEQLKILMNEPTLVVTEISKKDAAAQTQKDEMGAEEIDFDSMTKKDLQALAKAKGLSTKGTKAELIERLEKAEGE